MRVLRMAPPAWAIALIIGSASVSGSVWAQDDELCLACHADEAMFQEGDEPSRMVVTDAIHDSMHGSAGVTCVDCHTDLADSEDFPHAEELQPADCSGCHIDTQEVFDDSLHGYALGRGNPRAPGCTSCHGSHDILPSTDPGSLTHKTRLPSTCEACHGAAGLLTDQLVKLPQPFASYARSVHGPGNGVAASCADCHGVHDLRGHNDPKSRINHLNVAATCGVCHEAIRAEYDSSIHGLALQAGVGDSPTCNDCHGEHLILSPTDPDSKTYSRKLATETCGACHDDPVIIAKYNLQGGVVGSYVDSYHGWATRRDYRSSATCVSCHTAHAVLPEEHEQSTIHPDNLLATCGQCHEGINQRFATSYTHETVSITANPINKWIRKVYLVLIVVVIGGMIAHNLVIINFYAMEKRRQDADSAWVMRLDLSQILQHLLLAISFIALTVTGFALRFPEAWWVRYLSQLGMTEPVRANLHRTFGVILILIAIAHVYYVFFTRRGFLELKRIAPSREDMRQVIDNLRYHTWGSKEPARFGPYDYTQKAEYWALVWGTVLMALTGFVLWYPELAVKFFPNWIVAASQTIHYYEAWLATLAIVFWHFFFVIFHPEAYPMSWTWLTGKMTEREVRHHHAGWFDEEIASTIERPRPKPEIQRSIADKKNP